MPPKTRIPRERVEEAAFEIAREKGMSAITATGVAERLRCSTQPVYWWFGTMDSLKAAVRRRAGERYKSFLFQPVENVPRYKAAGINYIRFAKEERELFRILFMSETKAVPILESTLDENKEELLGIIRMQTGLDDIRANRLYTAMWIFTHGIAVMLAPGAAAFSEREIGEMLTDAYRGFLCRFRGREEIS